MSSSVQQAKVYEWRMLCVYREESTANGHYVATVGKITCRSVSPMHTTGRPAVVSARCTRVVSFLNHLVCLDTLLVSAVCVHVPSAEHQPATLFVESSLHLYHLNNHSTLDTSNHVDSFLTMS